MDYNKTIEVIATAIDPLAFSKDIHEAHQHCSPSRVEVVRDKRRKQAEAALTALQGEWEDVKPYYGTDSKSLKSSK